MRAEGGKFRNAETAEHRCMRGRVASAGSVSSERWGGHLCWRPFWKVKIPAAVGNLSCTHASKKSDAGSFATPMRWKQSLSGIVTTFPEQKITRGFLFLTFKWIRHCMYSNFSSYWFINNQNQSHSYAAWCGCPKTQVLTKVSSALVFQGCLNLIIKSWISLLSYPEQLLDGEPRGKQDEEERQEEADDVPVPGERAVLAGLPSGGAPEN